MLDWKKTGIILKSSTTDESITIRYDNEATKQTLLFTVYKGNKFSIEVRGATSELVFALAPYCHYNTNSIMPDSEKKLSGSAKLPQKQKHAPYHNPLFFDFDSFEKQPPVDPSMEDFVGKKDEYYINIKPTDYRQKLGDCISVCMKMLDLGIIGEELLFYPLLENTPFAEMKELISQDKISNTIARASPILLRAPLNAEFMERIGAWITRSFQYEKFDEIINALLEIDKDSSDWGAIATAVINKALLESKIEQEKEERKQLKNAIEGGKTEYEWLDKQTEQLKAEYEGIKAEHEQRKADYKRIKEKNELLGNAIERDKAEDEWLNKLTEQLKVEYAWKKAQYEPIEAEYKQIKIKFPRIIGKNEWIANAIGWIKIECERLIMEKNALLEKCPVGSPELPQVPNIGQTARFDPQCNITAEPTTQKHHNFKSVSEATQTSKSELGTVPLDSPSQAELIIGHSSIMIRPDKTKVMAESTEPADRNLSTPDDLVLPKSRG